jgi:hypothetical protein
MILVFLVGASVPPDEAPVCVTVMSTVSDCSTRISSGLLEELEYLKIETRLIDEKFASVMGECVI